MSYQDKLSKTALVLAFASIPACLTGYLSLPVAGVAFLIAAISQGGEERLPKHARTAQLVSLFVILLSYGIIVYSFVQVVLPALTSPEYRAQLGEALESSYGIDADAFFDELDALLRGTR